VEKQPTVKKILSRSFYLYRFRKYVSCGFAVINLCNPGEHYDTLCILQVTEGWAKTSYWAEPMRLVSVSWHSHVRGAWGRVLVQVTVLFDHAVSSVLKMPKVNYHFHFSRPPVPLLSRMNLFHVRPSCWKICFNIVVTSTFGLFPLNFFVKFRRNACVLTRDAKTCLQQFPFVAAGTGMRFPTEEEDAAVSAGEFGGRVTEKEK
jgi:hypothetical protein